MVVVIGEQNSIANQFLLELRDKSIQGDRLRFRQNLERLGEIMAYEISRKLPFTRKEVQTPLGTTLLNTPAVQPVLLSILRAGLPYFNGFQRFFDQSDSGFIGAFRKEEGSDLTIQLDYHATPGLEGKDVILIDPMLATGRSVTDTLKKISTRGTPRHLYLASVVASPAGILHLQKEIKVPFSIWTFAIDEKLNAQYYIVPGLGDAGDLSFGEKI